MPKEKNQPLAVSNQRSGLKWNGRGSLSDVPARDLTDAEVIEYGGYETLLASRCYEPFDGNTPPITPADDFERLLGGPVQASEE